jgi:hypothetical protein
MYLISHRFLPFLIAARLNKDMLEKDEKCVSHVVVNNQQRDSENGGYQILSLFFLGIFDRILV